MEWQRLCRASCLTFIKRRLGELDLKIVYWGSPLGDKTTNVEYIHGNIDTRSRSELVSLKTQEKGRARYLDDDHQPGGAQDAASIFFDKGNISRMSLGSQEGEALMPEILLLKVGHVRVGAAHCCSQEDCQHQLAGTSSGRDAARWGRHSTGGKLGRGETLAYPPRRGR